MWVEALDRLDADDAFVLGLVRQHGRAGHIADRVDAGHVGAVELIDCDGSTIGLHSQLLEPEILDIAGDTDRRDDALDGESLGAALAAVDGRGHAVGLLLALHHFGAGQNLDALLLERLAGEGRDLDVLHGQNLRQDLYYGNLGAERAVEARELDPNRTRADDQQRFRHALGRHGLEIGPDELLVGPQAPPGAGGRAGAE